ncbi:MAG: hypothetical protein K8W52_24690 [Deltaproteobacteria bacterium]|nr:hypothetical protein [Deltaproteobacteria bacterium]
MVFMLGCYSSRRASGRALPHPTVIMKLLVFGAGVTERAGELDRGGPPDTGVADRGIRAKSIGPAL